MQSAGRDRVMRWIHEIRECDGAYRELQRSVRDRVRRLGGGRREAELVWFRVLGILLERVQPTAEMARALPDLVERTLTRVRGEMGGAS